MESTGLGDEDLARRYGPRRAIFWFDERPGYRENNSRFWQLRRTLIHSREVWAQFDLSSMPLVPEWFGMLMPFDLAYRETGQPIIWCSALGFPTAELRALAVKLVEEDRPPGLLRIEQLDIDPHEYTLPIVGFLASGVYLSLDSADRRYDSWHGYETLAVTDDEMTGALEMVEWKDAERLLLRRFALNLGRWVEAPDRSDYDSLVTHARELWAMGAAAAAGAVAGTAMERLLIESLPPTESGWLASQQPRGPQLNDLIGKHGKHAGHTPDELERLHALRVLRNSCAHALSGTMDDGMDSLQADVGRWLDWLEEQSPREVSAPQPTGAANRPSAPELHAQADAAGNAAAEETTPTPMRLRSSRSGETITEDEGMCGFARVLVRPPDDPLARWLVEEGHASEDDDDDGAVTRYVFWRTQSVDRAAAYARAYVDVLGRYGIDAHYERVLD